MAEISEHEYEYVSAEAIQDFVIWIYTNLLRLYCFFKDLTTFKDPKTTVKAVVFAVAVFILSLFFSDAFLLWGFANSIILWPLAHQNKNAKLWLDANISLVNRKLEDMLE